MSFSVRLPVRAHRSPTRWGRPLLGLAALAAVAPTLLLAGPADAATPGYGARPADDTLRIIVQNPAVHAIQLLRNDGQPYSCVRVHSGANSIGIIAGPEGVTIAAARSCTPGRLIPHFAHPTVHGGQIWGIFPHNVVPRS